MRGSRKFRESIPQLRNVWSRWPGWLLRCLDVSNKASLKVVGGHRIPHPFRAFKNHAHGVVHGCESLLQIWLASQNRFSLVLLFPRPNCMLGPFHLVPCISWQIFVRPRDGNVHNPRHISAPMKGILMGGLGHAREASWSLIAEFQPNICW